MIIEIAPKAKKQMTKLPKMIGLAVVMKVNSLIGEQLNLQIKKLKKRDSMYRIRVGNYRIIYERSDSIIKILAVQHRKDVYRDM